MSSSVFVMTFCLSSILISSHQLPTSSQLFISTECKSCVPSSSSSSSPCYFAYFVSWYVGKEIIFDIWQSLGLMLNVKELQMILLRHIRSSFNCILSLFLWSIIFVWRNKNKNIHTRRLHWKWQRVV